METKGNVLPWTYSETWCFDSLVLPRWKDKWFYQNGATSSTSLRRFKQFSPRCLSIQIWGHLMVVGGWSRWVLSCNNEHMRLKLVKGRKRKEILILYPLWRTIKRTAFQFWLYSEHQDMFCTLLLLFLLPFSLIIICCLLLCVCLCVCLLSSLSRCKGEIGQEIFGRWRLQLHLSAAEPGGRHAVRRSQGGAVRPQPLGYQQDQAAKERKSKAASQTG